MGGTHILDQVAWRAEAVVFEREEGLQYLSRKRETRTASRD